MDITIRERGKHDYIGILYDDTGVEVYRTGASYMRPHEALTRVLIQINNIKEQTA